MGFEGLRILMNRRFDTNFLLASSSPPCDRPWQSYATRLVVHAAQLTEMYGVLRHSQALTRDYARTNEIDPNRSKMNILQVILWRFFHLWRVFHEFDFPESLFRSINAVSCSVSHSHSPFVIIRTRPVWCKDVAGGRATWPPGMTQPRPSLLLHARRGRNVDYAVCPDECWDSDLKTERI